MFYALHDFYSRHNCPAESTSLRLVAKFKSTGLINNQPTSMCHQNTRSVYNIAAVREKLQKNPRRSISCLLQELGFSVT